MLVAAGNGRLEVDQALISAGANKDKAATVVAQAGHSHSGMLCHHEKLHVTSP